MYSKSCPRVLDRPILFFGLEIEDLAAILSIACAILVLISPLLAVPVGIALFLAVRKLKEGKPSGYLFHLAYRLGLIGLLRRAMKVRHLVPIPFALRGRRWIRFSPATGSGLVDRKLLQGYWGSAAAAEKAQGVGGEE
jgi:hypothetical protein